jgi:hypothetical protein
LIWLRALMRIAVLAELGWRRELHTPISRLLNNSGFPHNVKREPAVRYGAFPNLAQT